MKLSFDTQIILNAEGVAYGFTARADYTAEHEQGLGGIHNAMHCGDRDIDGIARYMPSSMAVSGGRIMTVSERQSWKRVNGRKKTFKSLALCGVDQEDLPDGGYSLDNGAKATTWFDNRNFAVASGSPEADDLISRIGESAKTGDVAVFMGGGSGNPFANGCLVVVIPSLCPPEALETMLEAHRDAKHLEAASAATGIHERIDEKRRTTPGTGYNLYACSPSWAGKIRSRGEGDILETVHPVIYFLNSGKNVFGWYSVEEIDQWLAGSGKVVTDAEKYARDRGEKTAGLTRAVRHP